MTDPELYELRTLRDDALEKSHWAGRRRKVGNFSLGTAYALWVPEPRTGVILRDEGIRKGETNLLCKPHTNLSILEMYKENSHLTLFEMDLDIGLVDVHKTIIDKFTVTGLMRFHNALRQERKTGIHHMAEKADEQLLIEEMRRGASGDYSLTQITANEGWSNE